jgi:hypothetical protein
MTKEKKELQLLSAFLTAKLFKPILDRQPHKIRIIRNIAGHKNEIIHSSNGSNLSVRKEGVRSNPVSLARSLANHSDAISP